MRMFFAAIGPYLELLHPAEQELAIAAGVAEEYSALFTGERLKWMMAANDPQPPIEFEGVLVFRECAVPDEDAPDAPRQMYFPMPNGYPGDRAVADVSNANVAAEIAWFERTFTAELDIVHRALTGTKSRFAVRWGMVCWVY